MITFYIILLYSTYLIGERSRKVSNAFYNNFYQYYKIFPGSANTFGNHQNQLLIQNKDSERKLMIDAFV